VSRSPQVPGDEPARGATDDGADGDGLRTRQAIKNHDVKTDQLTSKPSPHCALLKTRRISASRWPISTGEPNVIPISHQLGHPDIRPQVIDEFTVPPCRGHHRGAHRCGDAGAGRAKVGIEPAAAARALWLEPHPLRVAADTFPLEGNQRPTGASGLRRGAIWVDFQWEIVIGTYVMM
jgi:hypothetical protein